jgi:hypothetical protein
MGSRARPTFDTVRDIAIEFPGVEESTSYGTRALKVKGKFLARLKEDGETLVLKCGFEERDLRMQARPDVYFNTPHYHGYPTVLVRLKAVTRRELQELIAVSWRRLATKRMIAEWDAR